MVLKKIGFVGFWGHEKVGGFVVVKKQVDEQLITRASFEEILEIDPLQMRQPEQ